MVISDPVVMLPVDVTAREGYALTGNVGLSSGQAVMKGAASVYTSLGDNGASNGWGKGDCIRLAPGWN